MSHGHVPSRQPGSHLLRPRSFPSPTKCLRCTSLMLGLSRQGLGCDGETPHPTHAPTFSHQPQPLGGGNESSPDPNTPRLFFSAQAPSSTAQFWFFFSHLGN